MRILLLSAYDAASHRAWREGLVATFPEHDWEVHALPPRHFAWRVRGNPLSFLHAGGAAFRDDFDLIVATSMVDVAALRGIAPQLSRTPWLVYVHENQFAYPESGREFASIEPKITSIYTALAAKRLLFNSAYNRDTFIEGAEALLRKMPDFVPKRIGELIRQKSTIVPVGLDGVCFGERAPDAGAPLTLVWNHRWEFDKGPERLLAALALLEQRGVDFRLHLIGQQFRNAPSEFETIRTRFAGRIASFGHVESRDDYLMLLKNSDVALSTSLHDFQGLAVLEAAACGCLPLVPDRLAYREYIPDSCRYASFPDDAAAEAAAMADRIEQLSIQKGSAGLPAAPDVSQLGWPHLAPLYSQAFADTIDSN